MANTPKTAIRFPRQLLLEMRGAAHRESLKRGHTVSWVTILVELCEKYLQRSGQQDAVAVGR